MKRTFEEISADVIEWSSARKIIPNSTPVAQARKTLEEAGELLEAAALFWAACEPYDCDRAIRHLKELKDAVGDVMVTLVNVCELAGVDPVECFESAYQTIKPRKGTLLPNGIFQKEE